MQVFYSFDYKPTGKKLLKGAIFKSYVDFGRSKDQLKEDVLMYRAFPLEINTILVRLENLADKFDNNNSILDVKFVDIRKFAS